jgi:hypothetical protein
MRYGPCGKFGDVLWATAANLLCIADHWGKFGYALWATAWNKQSCTVKICDDFCAMGYSAGFCYPLWAIAQDLAMRCGQSRRTHQFFFKSLPNYLKDKTVSMSMSVSMSVSTFIYFNVHATQKWTWWRTWTLARTRKGTRAWTSEIDIDVSISERETFDIRYRTSPIKGDS